MPLGTQTIFAFLFVEINLRKFSVSFQGPIYYTSLENDINNIWIISLKILTWTNSYLSSHV